VITLNDLHEVDQYPSRMWMYLRTLSPSAEELRHVPRKPGFARRVRFDPSHLQHVDRWISVARL
jgi:hypothetical protein